MASREEITAVFDCERVSFGNEDVPGDRVIIGRLDDAGGTTIKGHADKGDLVPGLTYRFLGTWTTHHKYGRQFVFHSFCIAEPHGERGLALYLTRCKGIGRTRAAKLVDEFGDDVLQVIRETPERVAELGIGITLEQAKAAGAVLEADKATEATMIELIDLLGSRSFPKTLPKRCLETWGAEAPATIRENPYILITFRGVGFLKADKLYLELGHDPAAIHRQGWCLWHAVHSDSEGHVWHELSACVRHLRASVSGAGVNPEAALAWAIENEKVVSRVSAGRTWIADAILARHEAAVVECLREAEMEEPTWPNLVKA